ncbi:MAG TPA: helix-turn-helix transcriptional regulator [Nitrobacter sp.]|nr:helix-turn-helix transcriptional regulator [Nitrobacter sp.]
MGRPSHANAIDAVYEAAMWPELWSSALELIADYLGADSGMLLYLPASRDDSFIISGRLREDLNHRFLKHHTRNPYGVAFARAPVGRVLATDMVVRKEILHRSAFYADILAPQGISEIVAVRHSSLSGDGPGGILFNLSVAQTNDAENALARLDGLKSHLSRAIDLTILASRLPAEQRHLDQVLATVSGAVVLLDRHGGILRMTPNAETLLQQSDGLVVVKGDQLTLAAQTHTDSARFAASLKQAIAVTRGEEQTLEGLMQIERPSGRRPLLVRMTPLMPQTLSPWNAFDATARVMVQIVDPQASTEAQAEHLRLLVGLSAAETRVAALLGSGLGLPETARALGVSLSTVKTHTKRIFHKADVHSSTALVRLLASIPIGPSRP